MNNREFSTKQEKRIAKMFGGKVVSNSGATKFNKGDIVINNILVECKTTVSPKNSFSIKKEWLTKNKNEAFSMGYNNHLLAFDFGDDLETYFVIDERLMKKLI